MSTDTDTTAVLAIAVAVAAAVTLVMAGVRSDPPVDCVLDIHALEHAEPHEWADWPVCVTPAER